MALNFLLKRSGTADKRPDPAAMALGELDLNYDDITGGIFYKNASGSVVKVGPAQVSAGAPNGTPSGSAGNSAGEFWYDTANAELKIFDGTSWVTTGVSGITNTAFTAAGNILVGTGLNTFTSLAVGTDGQVLIADSGEASGVRWGDFPVASTTGAGIVQLNDSVTSTSTTEAATANSVKTAYDASVAAQSDATQALADAAAAAGDVGDLSALTTTDKSSAVAAINEVDANADQALSDAAAAQSDATQALSDASAAQTDATQALADAAAAQSDATQALSDAAAAQATADAAIPCAALTAKGDLILGSAASTPTALGVGADGQVLTACAACVEGATWTTVSGGIEPTAFTATGDLLAGTGSGTYSALPVGTAGQFLVADSGSATGLAWADNPTAPTETGTVSSINPILPSSGTALCGGYYAGSIDDNGTCVALIIAPKDVGQVRCSNGVQQDWLPTTISRSTTNGALITECFRCSVLSGGSFAFEYAYNLNACGYNDWYIPARCEMLEVVRNLGRAFTSVPEFQNGGSQVMNCNSYSTATEASTASVWVQSSVSCSLTAGQQLKNNGSDLRLIRRELLNNLATCTALSFSSAQGFDALSVGDQITQSGTGAVVSICALDPATCSMTVSTVSGSLNTGCAFPLTGGYVPAPIDAGTDGQVLQVCTACDSGTVWANAATGTVTSVTAGTGLTGGTITDSGTIALDTACVVAPSILTTKGDIIAASAASTPTALSVGTDGQVLSANSACSSGMEWVDAGGGGGAEATPLVAGTVYGCIGFSGTTGYQCSTLLGGDVGTGSTVYCDSTVIGYSTASSTACVNKSVAVGAFVGTPFGSRDMVNMVAIGYGAMCQTPYDADNSIVIGALAGQCANSDSIYIGCGAGAIPTGTFNVAIGSRAMFCKSTLGCNVAIGTCAFYNINGGCNVAIGHCAGVYTGSTCLTGSNNTIIGAGALPVNNTASNEMILGNNALACIRSRVTSITAISDARDKTNITALPVGLDFVNALNPVKFTWQHREPIESKDGTMEAGFIAQEMDEVEQQFSTADYLDLVSKDDPNQWAVTQGHLIPVLVKAIQELSDKKDALEARIAALEGN